MTDYYPVFLDVREQKALVVGGGPVAERKVRGLLSSGAKVTVLSPCLEPGLRELAEDGSIAVDSRVYRSGDASGFFIVIAATDDQEVNHQVYADVDTRGGLVNSVDDPHNCRFIVPSTVERGSLVIAISTGGKSPALAKRIREEIEAIFPQEYSDYLEEFARLRQKLRERLTDPTDREEAWRSLMQSGLLELLKQGQLAEAEKRLADLAGEHR
ncbi:MAG: bifunctional precorrin-2 dehydrogenase/sirohydrochlorin ferrochelatase [Dehalococcoidia bacterium]|nr:bifunctional precorrin-2 dehydrogenase/sirohydrochlorin ferrochelatase [Dehalococcoidia bacterium]